ncbi:rhomboid family intramembrane serine protease [Paracoccus homiensis]|uniref:Membrane associated serine protease, rhomboid family n=1 Tax=Paracoccus homiensis TaxID=364199 RepID=A0A1H9YKE8_9RHOB|nr:rhomboid family intramembrane serine protease [Paracoccus homiensis]SES69522.1 Membrane associated serine protease, rhomboid family [Paracoccus homiensis]
MFPIRDHNPSHRTPFVTYALIAANIVMYLATLPGSQSGQMLWVQLALYPLAISYGDMLWGLLSHMFLHAGLMHIGGNMLFLWIFGDNLEDQMGHLGFLVFYLACGLAAAGGQILSDPLSSVPMVGASGAIAGVMGGYLLLFPKARIDILIIIVIIFRIFTVPAWTMLGLWFGMQLFGGFTSVGGQGGVAYWAHAGGFIAGVILAVPLFLRRGGPGFWQRTHGHPPHAEATYAPSRIPRVRR